MSAKHTPGPWKIASRDGVWDEVKEEYVEEAGDVTRIAGPDGQHVCGTCDGCNKTKLDDAKLIAAAPALADALEDAAGRCASMHGALYPEHVCATCKDWHAALRAAGRLP